MYRKLSGGRFRHFDFMALNLICLQLSFIIAYIIRHGFVNPYANLLYCNLSIFLVFADLVVMFFNETFNDVLNRGFYKEFAATVKHTIFVVLLSVLYLFTIKESAEYSRVTIYVMWVLYAVISYLACITWKFFVKKMSSNGERQSLLIVTLENAAPMVIENIKTENYREYTITGVVITDQDMTGSEIEGVPVVADIDSVADYVCREWVDEVLVVLPNDVPYAEKLMDDMIEAGVTVHVALISIFGMRGKRQLIEKIGKYAVITTSLNYMTTRQAVMKRALDIAGGIAGCILTGIIFLFLAPVIYIASPGPIFFSQVRVGKNGKKFTIYKFRSMYPDAEERKQEMMEQNRIKDGRMFKVEYDPRVIGNKMLSSGEIKTGIGEFIRRTSIDEFPQFLNVLKGDMSLVGTRPPTVDEWEKYERHHRARLATKPGITGMWQVNGRSNVTDFEEVVKLDTQYINEWSMGLDLRILFKTVKAVLKRDGSM